MTRQQDDRQISNFPKIGAPARRALAGAGISRLEQLAGMSEAEIKKLHGMGPTAIRQLRDALEALGLSFAGESKSEG